jgi:hypothetical protein
VEHELAARIHANVGFHVDLGLVGGRRDRPDAQTGARECAQLVLLVVRFVVPESVVVLLV